MATPVCHTMANKSHYTAGSNGTYRVIVRAGCHPVAIAQEVEH